MVNLQLFPLAVERILEHVDGNEPITSDKSLNAVNTVREELGLAPVNGDALIHDTMKEIELALERA